MVDRACSALSTSSIEGDPIARQGGHRQRPTEPIHPARNPYLNGVFAPVDDGLDVADLPVVEKIPENLRGADLRNGPNVKFPPLQLWIPFTRE